MMTVIANFFINYIKTRVTAEILKRLGMLILEECVKRTELKTDDAALEMFDAIESGDRDRQSAAMSRLMDSLELDAKAIFDKKENK